MGMPNQVHEAAKQIIENASDIHGALALVGRQDLVEKVIKIQKKAACIIQLERPQANPMESCRHDVMNAIGCLGHVIQRNIDSWPNIDGDEVVSILQLAESCVKRGHAWMDMMVREEEALRNEGSMENSSEGEDDACA